MAGDWIKMRNDLQTHPKVVRISSALRADRFRTIGGLHAVWCLFDAHSEDGSLDGYTTEVIDELVGFPGIAGAMCDVGWIIVSEHSVSLPEFDSHNGKNAKRRAQEADRKRRERDEEPVPIPSASKADTKRTRGEERRVSTSLRSVDADLATLISLGVDEQHAKDWLRVRKDKGAKTLTATALEDVQREAVKAGVTLAQAVEASARNSWRGFRADWYANLRQSTPPPGKRPGNRFEAAAQAIFGDDQSAPPGARVMEVYDA